MSDTDNLFEYLFRAKFSFRFTKILFFKFGILLSNIFLPYIEGECHYPPLFVFIDSDEVFLYVQ